MKLRPYIHDKDYQHLAKWVTDERTHALWCANRIPYPMTAKDLLSVLEKDALDWGANAYVATMEDGCPIGFFCYSVNKTNNSGFLTFFVVDKALRGQGYGTEMLKLILKYTFDITGVSFVQLNVFDTNIAAKKCYLNVGFVEDSYTPEAFSFQNERWGRCHMVISKQ